MTSVGPLTPEVSVPHLVLAAALLRMKCPDPPSSSSEPSHCAGLQGSVWDSAVPEGVASSLVEPHIRSLLPRGLGGPVFPWVACGSMLPPQHPDSKCLVRAASAKTLNFRVLSFGHLLPLATVPEQTWLRV